MARTREDVLRYAGQVVEDVQVLDHRASDGDGGGVASGLVLLQGDFDGLSETDAPPGVDKVNYVALVQTLASFCEKANDDFYAGDEANMFARYRVIRQHSAELLRDVNRAYGGHLHLK